MSGRGDCLAAAARTHPRHPALEIDGSPISYAALRSRVDAVAAWLRSRGVGPGCVISALLENGAPFVELLHATAACGATLLPLNVRATARELAPQVGRAGARLLVHGEGAHVEAARAVAQLAAVESARHPDAQDPAPPASATPIDPGAVETPDTPLAILFTSGTTGTPKGAMLSHENFRWSARASATHLGASPRDRWLACMPLYHVGGLSILLRAALYGNTVVLHERFDPQAVSDAFDRDAITCASLVPTMLARVLDVRGERPAPQGLRFVLLGGGPAPASLLERARAQGFPIAPTYGLTEAASQVATRPPDATAGGASGGLQPLPGVEVEIVDSTGVHVADGRPGELRVRSPGVMLGYVDQPEATRAVLRDGWLHTGDFARRGSDGTLTLLDRRSDLILSGGENVYPAEVEAVLAEHPAVAEAAVAAISDDDLGQRPAAWLVFRAGATPDAAELREFCRERLAGYKVPIAYHDVAALPRTASGKLRRRELSAAYGD